MNIARYQRYVAALGLISALGVSSAPSATNVSEGATRLRPLIEDTLVRARARVIDGTHAGENTIPYSDAATNYQTARHLYYHAYTNVVAPANANAVSDALKARVLGTYGWFLYATGVSVSEGTNLVQSALALCPTNATLNTKAAMIALDKWAATYNPATKSGDQEALNTARRLAARAVEVDPDYGYAYWILGQNSTNATTATEYRRKFLTLSNRLDEELWLYDDKQLRIRLDIVTKILSDTNGVRK
jgi:hypothetical protein